MHFHGDGDADASCPVTGRLQCLRQGLVLGEHGVARGILGHRPSVLRPRKAPRRISGPARGRAQRGVDDLGAHPPGELDGAGLPPPVARAVPRVRQGPAGPHAADWQPRRPQPPAEGLDLALRPAGLLEDLNPHLDGVEADGLRPPEKRRGVVGRGEVPGVVTVRVQRVSPMGIAEPHRGSSESVSWIGFAGGLRRRAIRATHGAAQ